MNNRELLNWARTHKEGIERRNRYLRGIAAILFAVGITILNYYTLASGIFTPSNIYSVIVGAEFEIALATGLFFGFLRLLRRINSDALLALALALTVTAYTLTALTLTLTVTAYTLTAYTLAALALTLLTLALVADDLSEPIDKS